jgi:hypothetical protein
MKLIKLDRRYHGFPKWTSALQFTKQEMTFRHKKYRPYVNAFADTYGPDHKFNPQADIFSRDYHIWNDNWHWDYRRRRIYFKDPSVMTFIELKLA